MIEVRDLSIRAGDFRLSDISFTVPAGGYAVLMGRTGSGKTTLLETLCGLHRAAGGVIRLAGIDVTHRQPADRAVGYVPQDRALFSTMTVRDNLAFALTIRHASTKAIEQRVSELADLLNIKPLLHRYPDRLSGGEAQRLALGRALAANPAVSLLDEPLSALDDQSRGEMHALLRTVRQQTRVTTLHVTHHRDDAEQLADQLLILHDGKIVEDA